MDYFSNKKINISLNDPSLPRQIKVMCVGDSETGKTTFIDYFLNQLDSNDQTRKFIEPTNSVDVFFKKLRVKDGAVLLNVSFIT
jgi:septin family protein